MSSSTSDVVTERIASRSLTSERPSISSLVAMVQVPLGWWCGRLQPVVLVEVGGLSGPLTSSASTRRAISSSHGSAAGRSMSTARKSRKPKPPERVEDRKSTRLKYSTNAQHVCRHLLAKKNHNTYRLIQ